MVGTYHKRGLDFIYTEEFFFPVYSITLPELFRYNLSDGLWFYSLFSTITIIWDRSYSVCFSCWLVLAIGLTYITKIFQALSFISEAFDWNDLLANSIVTVIYFSILEFLVNNFK